MPELHLGVVEFPYASRRSRRGRKPTGATKTTGDVAQWLENRYHVMEHFVQLYGKDIANDVANTLAGTLQTIAMGGPSHAHFGAAENKIEERFRRMLDRKELDRLGYPGIPTKASLLGISHRFKSKRGPPRPSFVDTGLYSKSFKARIDP